MPANAAVEVAHQNRGVTFGGRFMPEQTGRFMRKLVESGDARAGFGDFRNLEWIRRRARHGAEIRTD